MSESTIRVKFLGDTKQLESAAKKASAAVGKVEDTKGSKLKSFGGLIAGAATATAAVDFLTGAMRDAASESESVAKLGQVLKNAGIPKSAIASTEAWVTKLQNSTGVLDDELRPALAKLVSAGVPLAKSQDLLATALDISAARGVDLQSVVTAMGKAANGSTGGLGKLGLATKDAAGKALSFDQILKNANATMGGTAAKSADTAGGKLKILQAKFADVKETIGAKLLPVMTKLGDVLLKVTDFVSQHADVLGPLVAVIAAVTAATWLWNAAMAANPVSLIIIGIAALVAGLVLAYQKVGWFRDAVNTMWEVIKTGWSALLTTFKWAWDKIGKPAFDLISAAISLWWNYYIKPQFVALKAAFEVLWAGMSWAWNHVGAPLFEGVKGLVGGIGDAFVTMKDVVVSVWDSIYSIVKTIWNKIADLWNAGPGALSIHIPDWIPGIGGSGFDVPDLPHLAKGGIVSSPTVALIGEAGPEAVVPLSRGGFGGDTYSLTVYALDPQQASTAVVQALQVWNRQRGKLPIKVA